MAGAHVDEATDVAIRADHAVHFTGLQQPQLVTITQAAQFIGVLGQMNQIAGFVGEVAVAPGQVAVDGIARHPLADDFHRLQAHELHLAHAVAADDFLKLIQAMADAAN